uniref:Uncharacterized protein n=1 Tax=Parastrongyloides trichosuri TaxID=131310 RepID=A0A0N4ZLP1_PARTI
MKLLLLIFLSLYSLIKCGVRRPRSMNEEFFNCFEVCTRYGMKEYEIGQTWCHQRCKDHYYIYSMKDILYLESLYMKNFIECTKKTGDPINCGYYIDDVARVVTLKDLSKLNNLIIKYIQDGKKFKMDMKYLTNVRCRGSCIRNHLSSQLDVEDYCENKCKFINNSNKDNEQINNIDFNIDI